MKRISLLSVLICLVFIVGCGGTPEPKTSVPPDPNAKLEKVQAPSLPKLPKSK
jgi:PBP1b-binding outer membrane lipoprotein LpoB